MEVKVLKENVVKMDLEVEVKVGWVAEKEEGKEEEVEEVEKEVVDLGKVPEEETVVVVDRVVKGEWEVKMDEETEVVETEKVELVTGEKKVAKSIQTNVKYHFQFQPKSQDKFHQVWHLES